MRSLLGVLTPHKRVTAVFCGLVAFCFVESRSVHAGASFVESYVIISGGSQAGNYYYEVIDNGGNNVQLVNIGNYNLLSGTDLVLKGGQNKVTVTSPDYQKSWNVQSMNYRFYLDGSTVPAYSQMGNFTWGVS